MGVGAPSTSVPTMPIRVRGLSGFAEAHRLGMFTVLWCYLRNAAFQKDGVNTSFRLI